MRLRVPTAPARAQSERSARERRVRERGTRGRSARARRKLFGAHLSVLRAPERDIRGPIALVALMFACRRPKKAVSGTRSGCGLERPE